MNEELILRYPEKVVGQLPFSHRLVVWDAYRCHIMGSVRTRLTQYKIDTAVIPGGCTSFCNRLLSPATNVSRQSSKHFMMESDNHEFTPAGNMRATSLEMFCQWITDTWVQVTPNVVEKSFNSGGITAAIDESKNIICLQSEGKEDTRRHLQEGNNADNG